MYFKVKERLATRCNLCLLLEKRVISTKGISIEAKKINLEARRNYLEDRRTNLEDQRTDQSPGRGLIGTVTSEEVLSPEKQRQRLDFLFSNHFIINTTKPVCHIMK